MSFYSGLEFRAQNAGALEQPAQPLAEDSAAESLLLAAFPSGCKNCFMPLSDRDKAESAANQMLEIMDKNESAPISVNEKVSTLQINVKIGAENSQANKLTEEMNKAGYPLRVMFGPNKDREADTKAYENAKPAAGMTNAEALELIKSFMNHSDRSRHSEDIVKSWNYVRCHPGNDPIACPEGPISSSFSGSYLEISGAKGELNERDYARLNSALKLLEANGKSIKVRFE